MAIMTCRLPATIVIGADKGAAAFEVRNFHQLSFGKVQDALDTLGFFLLQIQQDLRFAVIDDALAIFTVIQSEKVIEVLCGADETAAIAMRYWSASAFRTPMSR